MTFKDIPYYRYIHDNMERSLYFKALSTMNDTSPITFSRCSNFQENLQPKLSEEKSDTISTRYQIAIKPQDCMQFFITDMIVTYDLT